MTIELALLISGVSLAFGIYQGITNMRRNNKKDDRNDAAQLTTVIVKLENISNGISEIKNEINGVKSDQKDDHDHIIRLDESLKSAWKRINEISGKAGGSNE
jgi:peptidoglycan hydrolase CwlO-like protein